VNISAPAIRRPIGTSLLAAAVFLAGMAAYFSLPVAPLPHVDFPTIMVQAALPGASPETMASSVATPLERRFGRIAGITEVTSSSSLGATGLILQFDLDRDIEAAARDVQAAINAAAGELPTNLPSMPTYRKVNPSDAPILILALTSDTVPIAHIYDVADSVLAQKISQVAGVGQVMVGGAQPPAVRVQADPFRLAHMGMTLADVRNLLMQANANQAKGSLQGKHSAYTLSTTDQLTQAQDYGELLLGHASGIPVRLKDVAHVADDVQNNRMAAWFGDKRAVLLIVRRAPGANILETIDRVKATVPALRDIISPAIHIELGLDRADTIRASVADVEKTLLLTVGLVILVVYVFLRSARATLIPSIAVPLSTLGTFAAMYLLGYSLDNLSLMALTISTGFVVDDAIVVTENIARRIEMGEPPLTATLRGAEQIGFTVVSITVSLLAVFIPVLCMQGIVGRLFREFAVTLAISIAVSAVVSLTLTPMLCARWLRGTAKGQTTQLGINAGAHASSGAFDRILAAYGRGLHWSLAHRRTMLATTLGTVALTVVLFAHIPKGLFPQQDTGLIGGFSETGQDVSFAAMRTRQQQANAIILADPDVQSMVSFVGASNGASGNTGQMFISLKARSERASSSDEVIARLRPKLAHLADITLYLQSMQDVRVGGRSARTQYQYTVQSAQLAALKEWAPKLMQALRKLPELKDVSTDQQTAGLQLDVTIDRDTASRLGITPQAVDDALYDAFGQRQVSIIYTGLNQYRVVLEVDPQYQTGPDALDALFVPSPQGPVPLGSVTTYAAAATPLAINHQGQFPAITLSFNLAPNVSLGQAVLAIHRAQDALHLPQSVQADFAGTAQAFGASNASMPWLIVLALVTVYVVLGMLYESFVHPITILSTLPSAGVGALAALWLCHIELSIIALVGIILLIGIVKKNAIMIVDFALEAERDGGLAPTEAIYQACLLRFRPILMTTAAALFAALPMALGQGTGAELRRPLGIAIVGGLLVSQMLTLFTTPVVYLALDRLTARRRRA
jgi:hydrophobe/amphiphile efflux-1 (HAE1) family protein